jgi:hypothetical protein
MSISIQNRPHIGVQRGRLFEVTQGRYLDARQLRVSCGRSAVTLLFEVRTLLLENSRSGFYC